MKNLFLGIVALSLTANIFAQEPLELPTEPKSRDFYYTSFGWQANPWEEKEAMSGFPTVGFGKRFRANDTSGFAIEAIGSYNPGYLSTAAIKTGYTFFITGNDYGVVPYLGLNSHFGFMHVGHTKRIQLEEEYNRNNKEIKFKTNKFQTYITPELVGGLEFRSERGNPSYLEFGTRLHMPTPMTLSVSYGIGF